MLQFLRRLRHIRIPLINAFSLYIDLGTTMTRLAVKERGIVLREPTFLGYNTRAKDFVFFGREAQAIVGKTPDFIKIVRPINNGIIADFDAEVALIKKYFETGLTPYLQQYRLLQPTLEALVSTPLAATEIEKKAASEALLKSGCAKVFIVEKPVATAAGCGFDVFSHHPRLVVDLGGGLVEVSIVSGGGIVSYRSVKSAGEHMNRLIANYAYLKNGIILGENTCEQIKTGLLNFNGEDKTATVRGKSLENGLPKSIKMKTQDIIEALLPNFNQIIDSIKELIEMSPPEIVDEIYENGITLAGGLAAIAGIDAHLTKELKIKVVRSDYYADATILGLIKLDENKPTLNNIIVT
ncbi:rod shape-determining protein [Patescibacteria group bacterium]|nr:rod shape-determining protein [Patescibacteria group bacterium]MCL5091849.1 rod shape-determining protein [Patescibacteria group bacterium]